MSIAEVAAELGVTPTTALKLLRSGKVPGGERLYEFEGRKGERWAVLRATFEQWCANLRDSRDLQTPR